MIGKPLALILPALKERTAEGAIKHLLDAGRAEKHEKRYLLCRNEDKEVDIQE